MIFENWLRDHERTVSGGLIAVKAGDLYDGRPAQM